MNSGKIIKSNFIKYWRLRIGIIKLMVERWVCCREFLYVNSVRFLTSGGSMLSGTASSHFPTWKLYLYPLDYIRSRSEFHRRIALNCMELNLEPSFFKWKSTLNMLCTEIAPKCIWAGVDASADQIFRVSSCMHNLLNKQCAYYCWLAVMHIVTN